MRTVSHLYDSYQTANEVASALERAGFARDDISVIANQTAVPGDAPGSVPGSVSGSMPGDMPASTATTGLSPTMAPGTTPVVEDATEPGTNAGTGASIGTLLGGGAGLLAGIGALAIPGVESDRAHVYAESVRRGDTLVTVRVGSDITADAEKIMQEHHPIDADTRAANYRADDGWTGFDETRGALTPEEMLAERERSTRTIL